MNNAMAYRSNNVAFIVAGITAVTVSGRVDWPSDEKQPRIAQEAAPSYSQFGATITTATAFDFAGEMASIYATLLNGQEPLGAEFAAILIDNMDSLYES